MVSIKERNNKSTKPLYLLLYICVTISPFHRQLNPIDRISNNLKVLTEQFNWKGIDFPTSISDYHTFENNNEDIALNVSFNPKDTRQIRQEYISHCNHTRSKQIVLLKITDGEKWHFLALKSIRQDDNTYKPL